MISAKLIFLCGISSKRLTWTRLEQFWPEFWAENCLHDSILSEWSLAEASKLTNGNWRVRLEGIWDSKVKLVRERGVLAYFTGANSPFETMTSYHLHCHLEDPHGSNCRASLLSCTQTNTHYHYWPTLARWRNLVCQLHCISLGLYS